MVPTVSTNQTNPDAPRSIVGSLPTGSPYRVSVAHEEAIRRHKENYMRVVGKDPLAPFLMRTSLDIANGIQLDPSDQFERVVIGLMDAPAILRLKAVSQLACASDVFPDGIHSRWTHVFGSACLTADILQRFHSKASRDNQELKKQIEEWGPIVVAFAMTHDLGHIAPGSHVAHGVWFKGQPDTHEEMSHRLLREDHGFRSRLEWVLGAEGAAKLDRVAAEDKSVPKWTWQLITAGGWNTDRGDWVRRDSHECGVSYGQYELPIIKKNLVIAQGGELAIREGGVSALEAFFAARADMYRNVYFHNTCRIAERMYELVGQRARELFTHGRLDLADSTICEVLSKARGEDLPVVTLMNLTESLWHLQLCRWSHSADPVLAGLSSRLVRRELFKEVDESRVSLEVLQKEIRRRGLNPRYFLIRVEPARVNLSKDLEKAIKVQVDGGLLEPLSEYSSLMGSYDKLTKIEKPAFYAAPTEAFPSAH